MTKSLKAKIAEVMKLNELAVKPLGLRLYGAHIVMLTSWPKVAADDENLEQFEIRPTRPTKSDLEFIASAPAMVEIIQDLTRLLDVAEDKFKEITKDRGYLANPKLLINIAEEALTLIQKEMQG